jgi:hypothetical protein
MTPGSRLSLRLSTRVCLVARGETRNGFRTAYDVYEDDKAHALEAISSALGAQLPWDEASGWPPDDQVFEISLTREQWRLTLEQLEVSLETYEGLDDPESLDLVREAHAAIAPHVP